MSEVDISTSIYFDTNILQDHFGDKNRFLDGFKLSNAYYALLRYINESSLNSKIKICVPRIVIEEMKEHLFKCFHSNKQSIKDKIDEYKKIFGDLIDIEYNIQYDDEEYRSYIISEIESKIQTAGNAFLVVECPDCLSTMIENALKTNRPFAQAKAKANGKEYSDAGFKDALLLESIRNHCDLNSEKAILFTKDGDFKDVIINENFIVLKELPDVFQYLDELYEIDSLRVIESRINNIYHRGLLLGNADCVDDESVSNFTIVSIDKIEEGQYTIVQKCTINETFYTFHYKFDSTANEITECNYEIAND